MRNSNDDMLKIGDKIYAIDISKIMQWVSTTPQGERNILTTITQVQPIQTVDYEIDDEDGSIEVASKEITENKTTLNETMNNIRYDLIKMILSELFTYKNETDGGNYAPITFTQKICFNTLVKEGIIYEIIDKEDDEKR